ncbi:iron-hydroxamate transporter permease subunit [Citrobacter freundii]|nr:iron-hydroxamate transporter permease subunit [Citrobacter freundii]
MLTLLLLRPMTLMGLDDGVARNLGLALSLARLAALSLAIVISALLVNAVGIIGFIGLFAPLLAKMLGARRLLARLMLAPLIGALILWLSDQIILWLTRVWMEVSTGSVTALIGAPLLLWLLPRLRSMSAPDMNASNRIAAERQNVLMFALTGGVILLLTLVVALSFGRDAHGWTWASGAMLDELMPWRWPRILAALIAGVMLAVAGCIIQRLTGNPMASPEVLGISSGAAFGVGVNAVPGPRKCLWLAAARREPRGCGHFAYHYDCRRARWFFAAPYAAGRDGAQYGVYYAVDDAAGQRRSAYGGRTDLDLRLNL